MSDSGGKIPLPCDRRSCATNDASLDQYAAENSFCRALRHDGSVSRSANSVGWFLSRLVRGLVVAVVVVVVVAVVGVLGVVSSAGKAFVVVGGASEMAPSATVPSGWTGTGRPWMVRKGRGEAGGTTVGVWGEEAGSLGEVGLGLSRARGGSARRALLATGWKKAVKPFWVELRGGRGGGGIWWQHGGVGGGAIGNDDELRYGADSEQSQRNIR